MGRRTYTDEQKAEALALYASHGAAETARLTGVPEGTLQSWAHRSGVATACNENRRANVEALKTKWAERRLVMVHEIGAVAHMALAQAEAAVATGACKDAKDFATTMAILVDKAQLLSGEATSRTESRTTDQLDREIERLLEATS
ncbi:MAG: transposase [Acidimicrobiales bacterium]